MNAARGALIFGGSALFLVLSGPVQGQIKPHLALGSLNPAGEELPPLPPRDDTSRLLGPAPKTGDIAPVRGGLGKTFWIGWGLAGAFSASTVEMTIHCEHIAGCSESNPLFGRRPSRLELYPPRAGIIVAGMLLSRHWKRRDPANKGSTILMLTTDAAWGADTAWDAHELSTIRGNAQASARPAH
jgi:hypothetical protein